MPVARLEGSCDAFLAMRIRPAEQRAGHLATQRQQTAAAQRGNRCPPIAVAAIAD